MTSRPQGMQSRGSARARLHSVKALFASEQSVPIAGAAAKSQCMLTARSDSGAGIGVSLGDAGETARSLGNSGEECESKDRGERSTSKILSIITANVVGNPWSIVAYQYFVKFAV